MARILLMEDDALQRALLAEMLEEAGHEVNSCLNATEARTLAGAERFDLVITDIIVQVRGKSLPDGGISLIGNMRRVGSESATPNTVPIIAVSGTYKNPGMSDILKMADQVGATDSLKKPIYKEELLQMVDNLLA